MSLKNNVIFVSVAVLVIIYCFLSITNKLQQRYNSRAATRQSQPPRTHQATTTRQPPPPQQPRPPPLVREVALTIGTNYCNRCVICLKDFVYSDICRVIPTCNRKFHAICIDKWTSGTLSIKTVRFVGL